jgi:hypothetical protein
VTSNPLKAFLSLGLVWIAIWVGYGVYRIADATTLLIQNVNKEIVPKAASTLQSLNDTALDLRRASRAIAEYSEAQIEVLRSPRSQKAIQAGIEVAAAAKGTILVVNTQILPRAIRTLDELNVTIGKLNETVDHTDLSVNRDMLPAATRTLVELTETIKTASTEMQKTQEDIHYVLADPAITESIDELASASAHLDQTMLNVEEATDSIKKAVSPKRANFWMRLLSFFVPKFTVTLN